MNGFIPPKLCGSGPGVVGHAGTIFGSHVGGGNDGWTGVDGITGTTSGIGS